MITYGNAYVQTPALSYHMLFLTFFPILGVITPSYLQNYPLRTWEFYFDIWSEEKLIFSESISGPTLRLGIKNLPPGVSDVLNLDNPDYKMSKRFTIPLGWSVAMLVLVCRKDTLIRLRVGCTSPSLIM